MKLGLMLCAFGLHRWRHFDKPWTQTVGKREVQMKASHRQCERCRRLEGFNRFLTFQGLSPWYEIDEPAGAET